MLTQFQLAACPTASTTLCWKGPRITSADVNRSADSPVGRRSLYGILKRCHSRETNKDES